MDATRTNLLIDLIELRTPLIETKSGLAQYPWDHDTVLAVVTREHITSILKQYIAGELNDIQVEDWANAIEGRDDIGFEVNCEDELTEAIHQLANPILTKPLSEERAHKIIRELNS